jgi:hypothetical protein
MKKLLTVAVATSMVAGSAMAGASASVDFVNAYVYRGTTVSDEFNIQPTVELSGFGMPEEYGEITLGAWGTMAPFKNNWDTPYETDWYLTYALPELTEGLDLYAGITKYTYNAILGAANENELNLGAGYALGDFYLGASLNYMFYNQAGNATEGQIYVPLSADWSTEISEGFTGSAGVLVSFLMAGDGNAAAGQDDGLNDYEIYGALDYALGELWSVYGSLTYIGQGSDKVLSDTAYDVSVLGMIGLSCDM